MKSSVLIVGLGGLGCPAAETLVRAGVGRLGIVDGDRVDESNLHRQLLYNLDDLGGEKASIARTRLNAIGKTTTIDAFPMHLTPKNAYDIAGGFDFIIDATDSPDTKFLLNEVAIHSNRPLSHAGVVGFHGQLLTIIPGQSACLHCVFPEPPDSEETPTCQEAGVIGPLPGWIGTLQAAEALSFLRGDKLRFDSCWMIVDAKSFRARTVPVSRNPLCTLCGNLTSEFGLPGYVAGTQESS